MALAPGKRLLLLLKGLVLAPGSAVSQGQGLCQLAVAGSLKKPLQHELIQCFSVHIARQLSRAIVAADQLQAADYSPFVGSDIAVITAAAAAGNPGADIWRRLAASLRGMRHCEVAGHDQAVE
ncbi:hypothetical protein IT575_11995 [bacterium]|nr:hypothetical protein [bacterium]